MKRSLQILLASAAVAVLPLSLQAAGDADCAVCPLSKTTGTTTTAATATCSASKGNYVMLKLKGGDATAISQTLAKLDGVSAADTCCESKFTKISYNKEKVCSSQITAALKDAGYKVQAQRITYAVDGLTCGGGSDQVTKALSKLKGVSTAKVCSETKQAVVDFDPARVSAEKILATLDATGFKGSELIN